MSKPSGLAPNFLPAPSFPSSNTSYDGVITISKGIAVVELNGGEPKTAGLETTVGLTI